MAGFYEKAKKLIIKHRREILYLFFGGVTTLVNFVAYNIFADRIGISNEVSNALSWCVSVAVAFFTNKYFVFESRNEKKGQIFYELVKFVAARLLTGLMDQGTFMLFHTLIGINDYIVKLFSNVLVIVANYFLSKLIIFRKKEKKNE